MIFRNFFNLKNMLRWRKQKPPLDSAAMDKIYALVSRPEFKLFLEYLSLTVEDKSNILTTMDLFDEKQRQEAIKLQYAMRGILLVADIAEELIYQAKENENAKTHE